MITLVSVEQGNETRRFRGFASYLSDPNGVRRAIEMMRPVVTQHPLIRIGGDGDGGYLVPDDLEGITACFSPGVSDSSDFEDDLVRRVPMPCFLADGSVDNPPLKNPLFTFDKVFIGTDKRDGYIPFADWVTTKVNLADHSDMLLQMDIEGAEFDAIIDTDSDIWKHFRIILIEFHFLDRIFARGFESIYASLFAKLTKNHHVVHLHPNNCCGTIEHKGIKVPRVLEVTLIRKDRCTVQSKYVTLPHPLDQDNVATNPTLTITDVWFRPSPTE